MENNLFFLIKKKIKKKYQLILATIFISVFMLNVLVQTMFISFNTLENDLLQHHHLSLILMQNYGLDGFPLELPLEEIQNLEYVVFAIRHKILGMGALDDNNNDVLFGIRPIPNEHSYIIGIEQLQNNTVYCPFIHYGFLENFQLMDVESDIRVISYDFVPTFVLENACFVNVETYDLIYSELHETMTQMIVPEYLIFVDDVRNVFSVVKYLDSVGEDSMILFQAHGLENVIDDVALLIVILISVISFVSFFSIYIVFLLLSQVIEGIKRDLMVMYLNGISRHALSQALYNYLARDFKKVMFISTGLFVFIWYGFHYFLTLNTFSIFLLLITILTSISIILLNMFIKKMMISRLIFKKISNENISKLTRN
jgi:hypothetical protein